MLINPSAFCAWTTTTALYQRNGDFSSARATIPLIFIFFFFYDLAYTPMLVAYTLEILPFRVRAKGFAVMVSAGRKRHDIFCSLQFLEHYYHGDCGI